MSTGLDCQDEYQDRQSCYYQYSMAIGDGFREEDAPTTFVTLRTRKRLATVIKVRNSPTQVNTLF